MTDFSKALDVLEAQAAKNGRSLDRKSATSSINASLLDFASHKSRIEQRMKPAPLNAHCRKMARLAGDLHRLLRTTLDTPEAIDPFALALGENPDWDGVEATLVRLSEELQTLSRWSEHAARAAAPANGRPYGSSARNLIVALAGVYARFTGSTPAVNRVPFQRFCEAVLETSDTVIHVQLAETIRDALNDEEARAWLSGQTVPPDWIFAHLVESG